MTLVNIDLRNQGYETGPDDRVVFYSLLVREGDFGTISTAPVEVMLTDGKATIDLAPGPVGVQIIAGQIVDTRVKIGEVPPSGPTTLGAVMMVTPEYTPALQQMMLAAVKRAEESAVSRVATETSRVIDVELGAVKAKADNALNIASAADSKSTTAEGAASNAVARITALEAMSGVSPESPADGQTANLIEQPDTLTNSALNTTIDARLVPLAAEVSAVPTLVGEMMQPIASRGALPGIFSLLAGTEDEVPSVLNPLNSRSADKVNFKVGGQAWKSATTFAGSLLQQYTETKSVPPFQAVSLWVYVEDASKVSDIGVRLYFDDTYTTTNRWNWAFQANSPQQTIVTGWNLLRIPADWSGKTISDRSTLYRWEVYAVVTAGTSVTFGHLYLETPEKAKCIIIADRGYQRFYNGLYQDLKDRNIPVTFAVDVTKFSTGTPGAADEAMSEALMHQVAQENGNSISFHGYDGAPTAQMTPEQLRVDTAKSIKWLQRYGYAGRMWRAAYVQNAALPESHAAVKDMLVGAASHRVNSVPNPWPPKDRHDIPRFAMDNNRTDEEITGWFDFLKKSHMLAVIFVHSEGSAQFDYTTPRRAHFLAQLDQAISEGWLEFHTFESLFRRSGGVFRSLGGAHVAEFTDAAGQRIVQSVM